ncbi:uncharacterized protein TrAFT101_002495 [Trichoderma asperellum]|uniref:uncharacterized protein n=1 Tax=Trichoderma asperellum TaxID=101201 RepID=UPI00332B0DF0|nr:hypothetical protein TrAFT101_002495 [Trichoderma asperellum]
MKVATPPSPAPISSSPAKYNGTAQSGPAVKDIHITDTATPSLKPRRPLVRSGSVVAEMRRLFERGSATYEPQRVASPTTTNGRNDLKTPFDVNSRANELSKTGILPTKAGDLEKLDQQEEKDAVPDLIPFHHHHVEHSECLPRPLASPDRSSRRLNENNIGIESKASIWQRGTETRFKLQGGAFLHKTPSPLKNMIVTGIGAWYPKTCNTSPEEVPRSESEIMTSHQTDALNSSLSQRDGTERDLTEHSQPYVPLSHPRQDTVSSSTTHATSDPKELHHIKSPSLKTSRSVPSHQSKVSSLRKKFDSSLPSSVSMPSF